MKQTMSAFQPVNTTLAMASNPVSNTAGTSQTEEMTPTTPRPPHGFSDASTKQPVEAEDIFAKTPTRDSFAAATSSAPLPPAPSAEEMERVDSTLSVKEETPNEAPSPARTADTGSPDAQEQDEKADGEAGRPTKKKKGQRFFCTGFPPCNLSFTRSEHLARHIRKHTGERPFGCHCGRRFSRLDNLRQHAQTVHVNEEIPPTSLAATGTRYQRQVRTERVRPTGRSRAATFSSAGAVSGPRGHNRTQSTSSIASASTASSFAGAEDFRRSGFVEPQRNRLSLDTLVTTGPGAQQSYYNVPSPSGYSTPTSATFSLGTSSPRFSSGFHTPASSVSRTLGFTNRRQSVPGSNPFQAHAESQQQSVATSPAPSSAAVSRNSVYNPAIQILEARREAAAAAEAEARRRTWHPNTTTGLGARVPNLNGPTLPELPRPVFPSQQQQQSVRLPPISSFEFDKNNAPPPPSLIQRQPSPMQLDPPPTSHPTESSSESPESNPNRISWTSTLQAGINRLGISSRPQSTDYSNAVINTTIPEASAGITTNTSPSGHSRQTSLANHPVGVNPVTDDRRSRRMGWYMQPPPPQSNSALRTSPDSSSSDGITTPVTSAADHHPTIVQNGAATYETHADHPMEGVEEPHQKLQQTLLPPPLSTNTLAQATPPPAARFHLDHSHRTPPHPPQLEQISEYRSPVQQHSQPPQEQQHHLPVGLPFRPVALFTDHHQPPPPLPPPRTALPPIPQSQERMEDRAGLEVLAAAARLSENQRA